MMEPVTIEKLNNTNSEESLKEFNDEKKRIALNECINEINEILSRNWHLRIHGKLYTCFNEHPVFYYESFYEAQKLFLENGIQIEYYQPHRHFSFKELQITTQKPNNL